QEVRARQCARPALTGFAVLVAECHTVAIVGYALMIADDTPIQIPGQVLQGLQSSADVLAVHDPASGSHGYGETGVRAGMEQCSTKRRCQCPAVEQIVITEASPQAL